MMAATTATPASGHRGLGVARPARVTETAAAALPVPSARTGTRSAATTSCCVRTAPASAVFARQNASSGSTRPNNARGQALLGAHTNAPEEGFAMPKVRTRMQPDVVIDVPDDEYEVLRAGGLLADDPAPAAKTPPAVQPATAAPKTTDAPVPAADTTTTKKG